MYGEYSSSLEQKVTLTALHLITLIIVLWLLFFNGIQFVASLTGIPVENGYETRKICIVFFGLIYFIRLIFTHFVFVKRELRWSEALTIALWMFVFYMTFSFTGGTNPSKPGNFFYWGIGFYLFGSAINTVSEYQRRIWKKNPSNTGRLCKSGLFRLSRHINYFGDIVMFTGFAAVTGSVYPFIIPAALFVLYLFVNIPILEVHLHEKYGADFDEYAKHTKKLIPYLY